MKKVITLLLIVFLSAYGNNSKLYCVTYSATNRISDLTTYNAIADSCEKEMIIIKRLLTDGLNMKHGYMYGSTYGYSAELGQYSQEVSKNIDSMKLLKTEIELNQKRLKVALASVKKMYKNLNYYPAAQSDYCKQRNATVGNIYDKTEYLCNRFNESWKKDSLYYQSLVKDIYSQKDSTTLANYNIPKKNTNVKQTSLSKTKESNTEYEGDRTIYIGKRGGLYYINKNGNKTYIKKKK